MSTVDTVSHSHSGTHWVAGVIELTLDWTLYFRCSCLLQQAAGPVYLSAHRGLIFYLRPWKSVTLSLAIHILVHLARMACSSLTLCLGTLQPLATLTTHQLIEHTPHCTHTNATPIAWFWTFVSLLYHSLFILLLFSSTTIHLLVLKQHTTFIYLVARLAELTTCLCNSAIVNHSQNIFHPYASVFVPRAT